MRERGRPALQDVWVCERGVDGHVLPIPVVRRKHEPLRVGHARVGAAERHDDVGLWRRGERDPVAVAERRAVDAGPDRQLLAATVAKATSSSMTWHVILGERTPS